MQAWDLRCDLKSLSLIEVFNGFDGSINQQPKASSQWQETHN